MPDTNGTPQAASQPPPSTTESPPANLSTAFSDALQQQPQQQPAPSAPAQQPATPSAGPPASTPQNPVIDYARSAGLDVGDHTSDTDFAKHLVGQYQQQSQLATWAKQLLPHASEITEALRSRQQPQQQPPAEPEEWNVESHFSKAWDLPKYNPSWDSMLQSGVIQKDATGRYVPAEGHEWMGMSPELRELNEFEAHRSKSVQDLFYGGNFYKNVWDKFQEPIERMIQEKAQALLEERFSQNTAHDAIGKFESQNESWLYDGQNMELVDGQPMRKLTDGGKKFFDAVSTLRQHGVTDAGALLQLASQLAPPPAQAGAVTPQPGAGAPPASGVTPEQISAQQTQSFLENAMARAQHSPSSGGASAPGGNEPVNATEVEIHNMFRNALRAHQAA